MKLPIDIRELFHGKSVEWERLEFKAGWDPLSTLHTLCAFANDFHNLGGGYLVVGVKERNGQPVLPPDGLALKEIDRIQKEILNLGNSALQPPYHPIVVPYEIKGRYILALWAPGGQSRPYKARLSLAKGDKSFGWFIRKGSSTVRVRGADEMELMALAATVPFDDRLNQNARVEDLSRDLIRGFLAEVSSRLALEEPGLDNCSVAIHGRSFGTQHVDKNIAVEFGAAEKGMFNIGLLHTSLDGREGHAPYAPCKIDDLKSRGYQYWALGHVHRQEFVSEEPHIVFPGCIQGRHIRETGPKGCVLVTVEDVTVTGIEKCPLDVLRWVYSRVDLTDASDMTEVLERARISISNEGATTEGRPIAMRVRQRKSSRRA
jgi:hypothetical protein